MQTLTKAKSTNRKIVGDQFPTLVNADLEKFSPYYYKFIIRETKNAYLVDKPTGSEWIPKSQIRIDRNKIYNDECWVFVADYVIHANIKEKSEIP